MSDSDLIIVLWPFIVLLAAWIFRKLEQRLPEKQAAALNQYAKYAVQKIEQQLTGTSSEKKNSAISLVIDLFKGARLPIPAMQLIDAAIESFVYELNQLNREPSGRPEPAITQTEEAS